MNTDQESSLKDLNIARILRFFLLLTSCVTALYLINTLRAAGQFASMVATTTTSVPLLSEFIFSYYPALMTFVTLWALVNIAVVFTFKHREWSYYFLVAGVVFMFFFEKIVWYANVSPIMEMINQLVN